MAKPGLKDLRTALHVLEGLDVDVPQEVYVAISDRIREVESHRHALRLNRMSDEELLHYENRPLTRLRITTPEGRIIQEQRNEDTFMTALSLIDSSLMASVSVTIRRHPLVKVDASRQRITGYKPISPGLFIYRRYNVHEMVSALQQVDRILSLSWEIEIR